MVWMDLNEFETFGSDWLIDLIDWIDLNCVEDLYSIFVMKLGDRRHKFSYLSYKETLIFLVSIILVFRNLEFIVL